MYIFPSSVYTFIESKSIKMVYFGKGVVMIMFEFPWKDRKKIPPKRKDFLKKSIFDCQQELNDAYLGLQNTNEPELIDRYIYEWNAVHMRYRVLLREMRELTEEDAISAPAPAVDTPYTAPAFFAATAASPVSVPARISSTNLETDTSLLNRSFR
jgi:hypothetical protein